MIGINGPKFNRVLKNGASRGDAVLRGFSKCSHMRQYAALSKSPRTLADGLMLVFQHLVKSRRPLIPSGKSRAGCRENRLFPSDGSISNYHAKTLKN
jgi:hypothetical protein